MISSLRRTPCFLGRASTDFPRRRCFYTGGAIELAHERAKGRKNIVLKVLRGFVVALVERSIGGEYRDDFTDGSASHLIIAFFIAAIGIVTGAKIGQRIAALAFEKFS